MLRDTRLPLATLITYDGREYDCTKRVQLNDLAFELGIGREVAHALDIGASRDDVLAMLWRRCLAAHWPIRGAS